MSASLPRRKKVRKKFPPCRICQADPGFTWACECGFSICTPCMNQNLALLKSTGRQWICPTCGRPHIGANR